MRNPIRVMIADDHALMRRGLRAVLQAEPDIRVVAEATSSAEAVSRCQQLVPEVAAVDLSSPALDGLTTLRRFTTLGLPTRGLGMAMLSGPQMLLSVLSAGGAGYVLKHEADTQLARAIRTVDRGGVFLYPSGVRLLLAHYFQVVNEAETWEQARPSLSVREAEVLRLTAEGLSNVAIGQQLACSPRAVEVQQRQVVDKLRLDRQSELLRYLANRTMLAAPDGRSGDALGWTGSPDVARRPSSLRSQAPSSC